MKKRPPYACTSGAQNWVSDQKPSGGRNAAIGPSHRVEIEAGVAVESRSRPTPHVLVGGRAEQHERARRGHSRTNGSADADVGESHVDQVRRAAQDVERADIYACYQWGSGASRFQRFPRQHRTVLIEKLDR